MPNPNYDIMRNLKFALYGIIALALPTLGVPVAANEELTVVVELFTSQGCSSCPPAEAFLGELATRSNVVALEFHVDYWDYIGWKDPFGSPAYTKRQRGYSASMGTPYVYTPQMVIQGQTHEVGSKLHLVERKIVLVRGTAKLGPKVSLKRVSNSVLVNVRGDYDDGDYDIFFVTFDAKHETKVLGGENRGEMLVNTNVVRTFDRVGKWTGDSVDLLVSLVGKKSDGGCALIVQKVNEGPIIAAAVSTCKDS